MYLTHAEKYQFANTECHNMQRGPNSVSLSKTALSMCMSYMYEQLIYMRRVHDRSELHDNR